MTNNNDEQTAQQGELPALWGKFSAALERDKVSGPIRAAHFAGERAAAIARTTAERDGAPADEAHARAKRAFWVGYFSDLAEEAAARVAAARDEQRPEDADPPKPPEPPTPKPAQ